MRRTSEVTTNFPYVEYLLICVAIIVIAGLASYVLE